MSQKITPNAQKHILQGGGMGIFFQEAGGGPISRDHSRPLCQF